MASLDADGYAIVSGDRMCGVLLNCSWKGVNFVDFLMEFMI